MPGTQQAKINSIFAPKTVEPVAVATPQVWSSVGVIFEIDQLGTTQQERMFYGLRARQIFMKHINPVTDSPAFVCAGDTQGALNGDDTSV
jgi:hypothetical protein